jgi:hypothetical protein
LPHLRGATLAGSGRPLQSGRRSEFASGGFPSCIAGPLKRAIYADNIASSEARQNDAGKEVDKLVAIDSLFVRVSTGWLNPESEIVALLFLRCHAALRTAAGEAMAGQVVESYRQCRGMMENAAYAVHIHQDHTLAQVWLGRHKDEAGMKASKRAFRHEAVVESVTAVNMHAASPHYSAR